MAPKTLAFTNKNPILTIIPKLDSAKLPAKFPLSISAIKMAIREKLDFLGI
jgi:hypothetical protein